MILSLPLLFVLFFPGPARRLPQPERPPAHTIASVSQKDEGVLTLRPGAPVKRELRGGESHSYELRLAAGQFLRAVVDQRGIDVVVTVFGPGGRRLIEFDSPVDDPDQGPELVSLVVEESGRYRIEVRASVKDAASGHYEVSLEQALEATPDGRRLIAADSAYLEGIRLLSQKTADSRQKALEKFEDALPHFRAVGDRKLVAAALDLINYIYFELGDFYKSLEYSTQYLSSVRDLRDREKEVVALNNISSALSFLSEFQEALEYQTRALEICRTLEVCKKRWESILLFNLGVIHAKWLGETQKGLDYMDQALQLAREAKDQPTEAFALQNIGRTYTDIGETRKGLEYIRQALPLFRAVGEPRGEGYTLNDLGLTYRLLGEKQRALDYHTQALALFRKIGERRGEADTLTFLGQVSAELSEAHKAQEYLTEALRQWRSVGDRHGEAATLYALARVARSRDDFRDARALLESALDITESLRAKVFSQDLRAAFFASARDYYELYIDVLMRSHEREPSVGFDALALQASERARARSLLETLTEVRADIRQGVDPKLLERERALEQRIHAKEQQRSHLLTSRNDQERAKAVERELSAMLTEYHNVRARIRTTSPRYAALTQPAPLSLKEIQQLLDSDTLLLEYALGDERSYLWAVTPTSINSFELPKRAEIESAARRAYDLLTARNKSLPNETPERKQARMARADAEYPSASAALSRMLLRPLTSQLSVERLLIVGDGALQYIPFGALPVPTGGGGQGPSIKGKNRQTSGLNPSVASGLRPLIMEHEVVVMPSASALAVLRREAAGRQPAAKVLAVMADPVFRKDDPRIGSSGSGQAQGVPPAAGVEQSAAESGLAELVRLHFSRREADEITRLVPEGRKLKALDFSASRAAAMSADLGQYRIIHFATHGLINSQHPELSGIVLSLVDQAGQPVNGFLRLYDIYNLRLGADLVVLSACQTALGKEIKGEGLVGLVRGFMYSGAPRVVASLWRIDDRATAELMKRFYERMLRDGQRPAAALREAQVSMWKDDRWGAPHYWAAFILQGEWK